MDGMNRKRVIRWVGCVWVLLVSLGFSSGAQGATFCVSDGTGLQAALTQAASNGEDDLIKIQEGRAMSGISFMRPQKGME